jgi:hypothetical protein
LKWLIVGGLILAIVGLLGGIALARKRTVDSSP